jgi:hypothetical protein
MPSNTDNPQVKEKNKTEKVRSNRYNADVNNILNIIGQFLGSSSLPSTNSSDNGIRKKKKNIASLTKKRPIHLNSENLSANKNASSSQEQTNLKEEQVTSKAEQVDKSNGQPSSTSSGVNTLFEENLENKDIIRMDLISDIFKQKDLENRMESLDI